MNDTDKCSQLKRSDFEVNNYAVIVLYVPVALLALVTNVLLVVVVIMFRWIRNATNYFLVNLAIADLLVTLVCMPSAIMSAHTMLWPLDEVSCILKNYLQCVAVATSVFTITGMALDRYLAISKPFVNNRWKTKKTIVCTIAFIWIISISVFSPILMVTGSEVMPLEPLCNDTSVLNQFRICRENWDRLENVIGRPTFGLISFIVMFAVPGLVLLVTYASMGKTLCSVRLPSDENNVSTSQDFRLIQERKRVAWILLILAFMFALCWLPYNIVCLLSDFEYFLYSDRGKYLDDYIQYTLLLGHANSAVNPIIYFIMSKKFRKLIREMCCGGRFYEFGRSLRFHTGRQNTASSAPISLQRIRKGSSLHTRLSRLHSSPNATMKTKV